MLRRTSEQGASEIANRNFNLRGSNAMTRVCVSGIGVEIPEASISNEELVESFNSWVDAENPKRAEKGLPALAKSDAGFIEHASGIKRRHVYEREGILDPSRMAPRIPARADDDLSVMAEFGVAAAKKALDHAGVSARDVDLVICASAHHQRPYPAIAIEIQKAIGAVGAGFDMGLGCSSALAGLHVAANLVRAGAHRRVLVVTPELITAHLNFRDRQTHFIFGDASVAVLIEALGASEERPGRFEIVDTGSWTQFSNNIRTNFGFLSRVAQEDPSYMEIEGNLIKQNGNKVFKDVTIAGHQFIVDFLAEHGHTPETMRRFWLHQANARMNAMILKLAFGAEVGHDRAPMVLDRLGNTAAAGAIIALKENHEDMKPGEHGLLCAFGAGYSIGGALMRMM
ncbi:3-oxoacyl-(acyl carrier protein) synthase III [Nitratireductor indicus C115]|uniref:3-oxoacyl-(Acyl carrier protein) synthase III n=2 Tax=Nitratireductor indicus TaxID=721133 RepID=K2NVQ0_9HYPH|nr:3-oxoacyl-(acyl carrier protein) synthase III [Nitratireductor indicus C115]SFQ07902.1 beta-ketodecanoyl-[acyl-carrier-protein] synthase [Nitratireductor indicus]